MADLSGLITIILPLALAAAVSPVALSVFLVIMSSSDDPKLPGLSFYSGAIVVLLITVFIGMYLGHKLTGGGGGGNPSTIAAIDIFLGAVLVLLGFRSFTSKHDNNLSKYLKIDKSLGAFSQFKRFFSLGFIAFLTNFSTAIFVLAAGRAIGVTDAGFLPGATAILILTMVTLIVIEVPLLFFIIMPGKAKEITRPANKWISSHGNIVTGLFCVGIGLLVVYNGISRLGMV